MNTPAHNVSVEQAIELALAHHRRGELPQAESIYRQVLSHFPEHAVAMHYLGVMSFQLGNLSEAEKLISRSIELFPRQPAYYNNLGEVYRAMRRFDDAETAFAEVTKLNPDDPHALNNLGLTYLDQNKLAEARTMLERANQLWPDNVDTLCNLGALEEKLGRLEQAREILLRAIAINPSHAASHTNLSSAFAGLGDTDQALAAAECAVALAPIDPNAHLVRSNALFHLGRLADAWPDYQWRLQKYPFLIRHFTQPNWDGTSLNGRTILLFGEQGFGDAIQFVRYAKLVAERGGKVLLECLPAVAPLLQTAAGIDRVIPAGETLPHFDVQCSLLDLPGIFRTELATIPAEAPYLHTPPDPVDQWAERLKQHPAKLRVGLAWAGSTIHEHDHVRSCKLETFAPLGAIEGITFFSLQKGPAAAQATNPPTGMRLIDYSNELHDFADAAALVQSLDLVITVDTAAAHLAGALARPVWMMLAFVPEWRWMRDRSDSPWYPTMKLFRQPSPGDWQTTIEQISPHLRQLVDQSR